MNVKGAHCWLPFSWLCTHMRICASQAWFAADAVKMYGITAVMHSTRLSCARPPTSMSAACPTPIRSFRSWPTFVTLRSSVDFSSSSNLKRRRGALPAPPRSSLGCDTTPLGWDTTPLSCEGGTCNRKPV